MISNTSSKKICWIELRYVVEIPVPIQNVIDNKSWMILADGKKILEMKILKKENITINYSCAENYSTCL
jgi:hypothetical protein